MSDYITVSARSLPSRSSTVRVQVNQPELSEEVAVDSLQAQHPPPSPPAVVPLSPAASAAAATAAAVRRAPAGAAAAGRNHHAAATQWLSPEDAGGGRTYQAAVSAAAEMTSHSTSSRNGRRSPEVSVEVGGDASSLSYLDVQLDTLNRCTTPTITGCLDVPIVGPTGRSDDRNV